MGSKPTARDVASEAGVSLATVDRVLNNRGGVAADKEWRVVNAARRLKLDRSLDFRAARTLRIAVLIQPPSNPFHAALAAAVEEENRGTNPFNFQFSVFHIDPVRPDRTAGLIGQVSARFDALMICAAQQHGLEEALVRFAVGEKPVVALATDLAAGVPHIYVGPDNLAAGRVAGDLMGRLVGSEGGDILLIAGMLAMMGHEQRCEGFRAVLSERYPRCRIVAVKESAELGERAGDLVAEAMVSNLGLRGIYNASAGAQQIADVVRRMDRIGSVVFITHELSDARRHLLRLGAIDAIIDQNPRLEIKTAVEALATRFGRLAPGPSTTLTPVQIHMIENC